MQRELDQATMARIKSMLPDLSSLGNRVLGLPPNFVSMAFDPDSSIPVAAPCLVDAFHVACEARYSLSEAHATLTWYREKIPEPNEKAAIWHARFYTTAAASCLYAAAEDVANAIVEMFAIDRLRIETQEGKCVSLQSRVGVFLSKKMPNDALTRPVCDLGRSDSWCKTMLWRNRWVHEQSQVQGLGIVYNRNKRWKASESLSGEQRFKLHVGTGGDNPEYSVDDVLSFVCTAFSGFVRTLDEVVTRYLDILSSAGITSSPPESQ